jgi:hypothetical protein
VDSAAFEHAKRARDRADRALARLKSAPTLEDAEEAWDHFLHAASRVHEKLRAGVKGHPRSWAWFKKKLDERANDEFLAYMHHARNCDHHRIEEISKREPANTMYLRGHGPKGPLVFISRVGHLLVMLPVIDKGVEYPVPRECKYGTLADSYASSAGHIMMDYLGEMLEEAESLLR